VRLHRVRGGGDAVSHLQQQLLRDSAGTDGKQKQVNIIIAVMLAVHSTTASAPSEAASGRVAGQRLT
jgi:hypothetical protein